ncbi:MAG: TIGR02687 family protein [Anaerolineaceae bacterium]|nr:TIGR02687 family protein [Anaerolineaceae bacterium]
MNQLSAALTKLFDQHRIVFWYDANRELRTEFNEVWLPGVEKLEINHNEFWLKQHILREKKHQKFLIYHDGPQPIDEDNWLLDVILAQGQFKADQISLWLSDMGLTPYDWDFVQAHEAFFKREGYRAEFKVLWSTQAQHGISKERVMLSISLDSKTILALEEMITILLAEAAAGEGLFINRIESFGLADYLWKQTERAWGYHSDQPTIKDFAVSLFKACYALELNQQALMKADALNFMQRWKDSMAYAGSFAFFSSLSEGILGIKNDLNHHDLSALIEMDLFEEVDRHIIKALVAQVNNRTLSGGDANNLIWRRRKSHWYEPFKDVYLTIQNAAQFFSLLGQIQPESADPAGMVLSYSKTWSHIDRLYRKVIFHAKQSGQISLLQELLNQVESQYGSRFVLAVNDIWQQAINPLTKWEIAGIRRQDQFYDTWVKPFVQQKTRLVVLISDAFRYEIAQELGEMIEGLKGFETTLEPMLTLLPSYTQLGMAALLPHDKLEIKADGAVLVDGKPSNGVENRDKLLKTRLDQKAAAIRAEALLGLNRDEMRDLLKENPLLYVYHNHIDAVGDKRESEHAVFNAVEKTIQDLVTLTKRLANAAVSHILITADHGFLYQDRILEESDFAGQDIKSDVVTYKTRRFALGHQVQESSSATRYMAAQIGLNGDLEIHIPKSINRFRLQGAGSRFVHGGSALQEVVIPVLKIHKAEGRETPHVNVEIIRGTTNNITSGQFSVTFFQKEAVSGEHLPRELRAGLYAQDKDTSNLILISDQHTLTFDLISENAQEREVKRRFILNNLAEQFNNQEVTLLLDMQETGTTHFKEYKKAQYQLRKSFADFDF